MAEKENKIREDKFTWKSDEVKFITPDQNKKLQEKKDDPKTK